MRKSTLNDKQERRQGTFGMLDSMGEAAHKVPIDASHNLVVVKAPCTCSREVGGIPPNQKPKNGLEHERSKRQAQTDRA
eukprot:2133694-Amphidinium_carterae.1